jgi:iron complex outermembrane receptor protein
MLTFAAAVVAHLSTEPSTQDEPSWLARRIAVSAWGCGIAVLILLGCFAAGQGAFAQNTTAEVQKPAPAAQPLPRVTTTVVVHGEIKDDYLPDSVTVGSLDGATLQQMPLSATVITRELLTDQGARILSDVVKNDAAIGEDYAPVGYYSDFEIRGFPVDFATGFQINGMTVAGEQDVQLENKDRVEFLKGIAGLDSGVASAGGLINYVTKRPAVVKSVDLATDHRGSSYGAVDLGRFFGRQKQVGLRVNLAGEKIQSYVNDTNGWRTAGAAAADWKLSQKATLKGDFEYQHKVQRDSSGYQLLGGTVLPDLDRVYPSTMLGEQSWLKPNTFDTFNTSARLDYQLPRAWRAFAQGSYSHSLIDDNVIYAYGCAHVASCTDFGGVSPDYYFAPDGSYDIFDYRNPGELRINAQIEALVFGHVKTGPITHDLAAGGVALLRSFQQPSSSVYYYIGNDNIYAPITPLDLNSVENPHLYAGPRVLNLDNHQSALILQDRIHLPGRVQLLAGGRYDSVRDHNFGGSSTTNKKVWLPQYAVTYSPAAGLMLYGNYGVLLSLGPQAPWWAGGFYMDPYRTRQAEVGAKFQPGQRILLTAALFHMRAPFFYPKTIDDGSQNFVMQGHETHNGIELNAEGKAANWLRLTASAAAIRAISDNTGTTAFDNKQVLNVPHLRTSLFADLRVPHMHELHLMPGWSYTGRKEATRDNAVSVASYNIFNLGARYTPEGMGQHVTLRLYTDNIFNKRYWKDTGASGGDNFLWLGAPTTVRLSAHYTF